MAHSVSEAAARAVKNSERKKTETRTPDQRLSDQRLSDIRKNLAAGLFIIPDDQRFLLELYDISANHLTQAADIANKYLQQTRDERDDLARQLVSARELNVSQSEMIQEMKIQMDLLRSNAIPEIEGGLDPASK